MHFEYVLAVFIYVEYKLLRVYLRWSANENLKMTVIKAKWPVIHANIMYVSIYLRYYL